ncbi:MAG: glycosyltransferase family 2 protein, partial [Alphaproteobacteria bacterium]
MIKQSEHGASEFRPRVSVVIPVYNRANLICRAVESVLRQTYSPYEVIVVDDASSDKSAAIAEAIRDPRVQVIRNEVNRGGGAARNIGIDAALGDYIAFLDSDDMWHRDKLE